MSPVRFQLNLTVLIIFTMFCITVDASNAKQKDYEVLSLSAAIIDHLVCVTEKELSEISSEKGSWQPIDYPTLCSKLNTLKGKTQMCPGGSGVNVIKGLAHLGHHCAVIGQVGTDEMGDFFIEQLDKRGITSFLERQPHPTGQAICFITPEGERTFLSYLDSSPRVSELNLNAKLFEHVKLFHVEGYQLVEPEVVLKALKLAKSQNVKISMDLANIEIVRRCRAFIHEVLKEYVDIVLCNQDEAKELTGLPPQEACEQLAKSCAISVVTMGEKGCWTQGGEGQFFTPAFFVEPVDSTGAGDYFASGFLHGILTGAPLQTSALQGALIASYVVTQIGTELNSDSWNQIHNKLQSRFYVNVGL